MHGYTTDKPGLGRRLKRIEGQVRGIAAMVDDDRYCIEIITQIRAARAALSAVEAELLKAHVSHCIMAAVAGGSRSDIEAKLDELIKLLPHITAAQA